MSRISRPHRAEAKCDLAPRGEHYAAADDVTFHRTYRPFSIIVVHPADGLPHLPPVLTDVTMDQALDLVSGTFRGVVLYGFCASANLYDLRIVTADEIYATTLE